MAIAALVEAGLIDDGADPDLRLLSRVLVVLRLVAPEGMEPAEQSRALVASLCGHDDWPMRCLRRSRRRGSRIAAPLGTGQRENDDDQRRRQGSGTDGDAERRARASTSPRRARPLVLYFYPKDDTSGCTREAQDFTELADDFAAAGARVVGVSRDQMKKHDKFIAKYDLKVPLASDEDGAISRRVRHLGRKVDVRPQIYGDGARDLPDRRATAGS